MNHIEISSVQKFFRYLAFIVFAYSVIGCGIEKGCEIEMKKLTHQNGLSFEVPGCPEFSSIRLDDGFKLTVQPSDARSSNELQLRILSNKPVELDKNKTIDGSQYSFAKEAFDGGSGGPEHTLKIWKALPDGRGVYLDYYAQTSNFDKDYAWEIIESARLVD